MFNAVVFAASILYRGILFVLTKTWMLPNMIVVFAQGERIPVLHNLPPLNAVRYIFAAELLCRTIRQELYHRYFIDSNKQCSIIYLCIRQNEGRSSALCQSYSLSF